MATFTVQFRGVHPVTRRVVRRTFRRVRAADTYAALDVLRAHPFLRRVSYLLPAFSFGVPKSLISRSTLRRALSATPEQEEKSTDAAVPASSN